jgi:hypothetical protein
MANIYIKYFNVNTSMYYVFVDKVGVVQREGDPNPGFQIKNMQIQEKHVKEIAYGQVF